MRSHIPSRWNWRKILASGTSGSERATVRPSGAVSSRIEWVSRMMGTGSEGHRTGGARLAWGVEGNGLVLARERDAIGRNQRDCEGSGERRVCPQEKCYAVPLFSCCPHFY